MRRTVGILSTAVAPLFLAAMAIAGEPGSGTQHYGTGSGAMGSGSESGGSGTRGSGSTAGTRSGSTTSEHQMSGTITSLDKEEGQLTFKGSDGKELELQLPRTAVQNLKEGEHVTLQIAIKPSSRPTSGAGAPSGESGSGSGSKSPRDYIPGMGGGGGPER